VPVQVDVGVDVVEVLVGVVVDVGVSVGGEVKLLVVIPMRFTSTIAKAFLRAPILSDAHNGGGVADLGLGNSSAQDCSDGEEDAAEHDCKGTSSEAIAKERWCFSASSIRACELPPQIAFSTANYTDTKTPEPADLECFQASMAKRGCSVVKSKPHCTAFTKYWLNFQKDLRLATLAVRSPKK
jgi:hypothetical protein